MRKKKILKEDERVISVKVEFDEKYLNQESFLDDLYSNNIADNEILLNLTRILDSLSKTRIRNAKTCIEYGFNRKKFVLIGGFSIPDKINIDKQATRRIGEAMLDTIGIEFNDSPLGLDRIRIRGKAKEFDLRFQNKYAGNEGYITTLTKSIHYLKEIMSLWVMEK